MPKKELSVSINKAGKFCYSVSGDEMTHDDVAGLAVNGLLGCAHSITDEEESVMQSYINLIDYALRIGGDRWGKYFKEAVEIHKMGA